ncbi:cobalamin B12-binding domain-containing protein [Pontibacillus yanchengensis]|nr:cobalamin B12-binding domain-containing protein [Pontibacillus yanchengensis]
MNHYTQMAKYFLEGNEDEALQYLQTAETPFNRLLAFENLLTPTMYHIGDLWENNQISVADEHLATAVCDFVLSQVDYRATKQDLDQSKKVLLFGVEEEQHYLGLKMVASVFRDQGWKVRYLGPNLPLGHVIKQIDTFKPDVIGVSASLSYRLPKLQEVVESFQNLEWNPQILIGGRMAKKHDLSKFVSDKVFVMKDLEQLQGWLEGDQNSVDATSS